jgi:hypothetical protein
VDLKAWFVQQGIGATAKILKSEFAAVLAALQRAISPLPSALQPPVPIEKAKP